MRRIFKKRKYLLVGVLIGLLGALLAGFYFLPNQVLTQSHPSDPAEEIYQKCSPQGKRKTSCYDNSLAELTKNQPMEEVFSVARTIQKRDFDYAYCHVLGHKVASEEVKKNSDNWKQVIQRCPPGQCANGCIHGAFQEKLNAENLTDEQIEALKPELITVCQPSESWKPSYMDQTACFHALGHMFMYMTTAKMQKSLDLCDQMMIDNTDPELDRYCYEGSFMQVFQSIEPEDKALTQAIRPRNKEEVVTFCNQFSGTIQATCWSQSWPLFIKDLVGNPASITDFCSHVDSQNKLRCYGPIFNIISVQQNFNPAKLIDYCQKVPAELRQMCHNRVAGRMIDVDNSLIEKAAQFCQQIDPAYQSGCFEEILRMFLIGESPAQNVKDLICPLFPSHLTQRCQDS